MKAAAAAAAQQSAHDDSHDDSGDVEFTQIGRPVVRLETVHSVFDLEQDFIRCCAANGPFTVSSELASRVLVLTMEWLKKFDCIKHLP